MRTCEAILPDADHIHRLIATHFESGTPRRAAWPRFAKMFVILWWWRIKGAVIGCGALHLFGLHLAEIRSLAVHPYCQGKGAIPKFFAHLGFSVVNREQIPDKLYRNCSPCPKLRCCDEVAMLRGQLPTFVILGQPVPSLGAGTTLNPRQVWPLAAYAQLRTACFVGVPAAQVEKCY